MSDVAIMSEECHKTAKTLVSPFCQVNIDYNFTSFD